MFMLDFFKPALNGALAAIYHFLFHDFMLTAFYMFLVCCTIMYAASRACPEPLKNEARPLVWEDWREPLRGAYLLPAALVVVTFIILYSCFA